MSSSNTNTPVINAPVVAEKKPRVVKPKLSAKYSKFLEFGYVFVQSLHGKGTLSDEGLESAYSELKLFDEAESQTEFYEQVLVQCKETGKSMRKFVTQRNKPPKAVKARKPRAKKEKVEVAASTEAVEGGEAPVVVEKEKKARKPRAKKTTNVVQDTANDLVGELVAAANAPVVEEAKEEPKAKKETKPKAKKEPKAKAATATPAKSEEAKEPAAPKKAAKPRAKKAAAAKEPVNEVVANLAPQMEEVAAEVEEELEEEEISTQEITIQGKEYLIDESNNLYSVDTHAEIGTYNPETKAISCDL